MFLVVINPTRTYYGTPISIYIQVMKIAIVSLTAAAVLLFAPSGCPTPLPASTATKELTDAMEKFVTATEAFKRDGEALPQQPPVPQIKADSVRASFEEVFNKWNLVTKTAPNGCPKSQAMMDDYVKNGAAHMNATHAARYKELFNAAMTGQHDACIIEDAVARVKDVSGDLAKYAGMGKNRLTFC
ncbi:hypothetical protein SeLEV6574_g00259 [Synchytrium endobioticum]|uniref:Uncharacterized protein n=1 Tax=Synchytrium endobioticum TaxID=286115 RepID=A0A507DKR2_9FUNG|nr:hypothetical protein SeLEV6574_g00259 [Synchytrium endobioticum]